MGAISPIGEIPITVVRQFDQNASNKSRKDLLATPTKKIAHRLPKDQLT